MRVDADGKEGGLEGEGEGCEELTDKPIGLSLKHKYLQIKDH